MEKTTFETWKILQLETGLRTNEDFRNVLPRAGCSVGPWADVLLGSDEFATSVRTHQKGTLQLVLVSGLGLGFPDGALFRNILERACRRNLMPLPAVAGPLFRLQYLEQPKGKKDEGILVGMTPIKNKNDTPGVFNLSHGEAGLFLGASHGHPNHFWPARYRWLFAKRP